VKLTPINWVLAGMILLLGGLELMAGRDVRPEREVGRLFPGFFADEATRILIEDGDQRMELVRLDGGWVCPEHHDYPAWEEQVEVLMRALTSMTTLDLLSPDATSHDRYGLAGTPRRVRIWDTDGEALVDLLQGDDVPGGRAASYVRRFGEDEVYRAPFLSAIPVAPKAFLSPRWMAFEPAEVIGIRIEGADFEPPLELLREERRYVWKRGKRTVAKTRVDAFLSSLASLYLEAVVAGPNSPQALGESVLRVELTLLDGTVLAGQFAAQTGGRVRARRDPDGWVIELPADTVGHLVQRAQQL
jgi:Domain of unknown function (DUF4340)